MCLAEIRSPVPTSVSAFGAKSDLMLPQMAAFQSFSDCDGQDTMSFIYTYDILQEPLRPLAHPGHTQPPLGQQVPSQAQPMTTSRTPYRQTVKSHPAAQVGLQQQQHQQQIRDSGRGVGANLAVGSPPQANLQIPRPGVMSGSQHPQHMLQGQHGMLPGQEPHQQQRGFPHAQQQHPQQLPDHSLSHRQSQVRQGGGNLPGMPMVQGPVGGHLPVANGHGQLRGAPIQGAGYTMPSHQQGLPPQQQQQQKRARQAPPLQTAESADPAQDEMKQFAYQLMQEQQQLQKRQEQQQQQQVV